MWRQFRATFVIVGSPRCCSGVGEPSSPCSSASSPTSDSPLTVGRETGLQPARVARHVCIDRSWADDIDADLLRGIIQCEVPTHALDDWMPALQQCTPDSHCRLDCLFCHPCVFQLPWCCSAASPFAASGRRPRGRCMQILEVFSEPAKLALSTSRWCTCISSGTQPARAVRRDERRVSSLSPVCNLMSLIADLGRFWLILASFLG